MKNIQVIDDAINCSFSVYAATDEDFAAIFCQEGQDVEFIEDLVARVGPKQAGKIVLRSTSRSGRVDKCKVCGIHGTLFFGLLERKKWYPNKRESDLDDPRAGLRCIGPRGL